VGGLFLSSFATALLAMVGLFLLLEFSSKLDDYLEPWEGGGHAPLMALVEYLLWTIPGLFLQLAPFATLAAGLFTATHLQRTNETVGVLSAGTSSLSLLRPVLLGGLLVALCMVGLRERGLGICVDRKEAALDILNNQRYERTYRNILVRDQDGNVVRLARYHPGGGGEGPRGEGLTATFQERDGWMSIEASSARWVSTADAGEYPRDTGYWALTDGVRHRLGREQTQEAVFRLEAASLTPTLASAAHRARADSQDLSLAEVRALERRDVNNVLYPTLRQIHLTFPLANLVLLLIGLPLVMRQPRSRAAGGIALACLACLFYFSADFVLRALGLQGSLSPLLATWLPILFFGSLGCVAFANQDT
jgi:lipopolysaccharide export system permease protein